MQIELLKSLVEELAGVNSGLIVDILFNKKDINEFLIAKKMNLTINQVRNILYKLSGEGLVSFIRKKDKKKGWYIYFWTLNTEKCLIKLEQALIKKIQELNNLLHSRESKRFYLCKSCDIEVGEETALDHGFSCEECGEVYDLENNEKPIKEIKSKILKREKELAQIKLELVSVREKLDKKSKSKEKKAEKAKKKKAGKKKAGKKAKKREKSKKSAKKIKKKKKKSK